jgi:hypothetical protein
VTVRWFESGDPVQKLPYEDDYNRAVADMAAAEVAAIFDELNAMIDQDEIHTSSWMPGSDWSGTVFSPIYNKAANKSYERSAQIFGLMVFKTFMERPEDWYTGRFEKDGRPIGGRTYFRSR